MSRLTWLFLYLAGLAQLAVRYRLEGRSSATYLLLLPLLPLLLILGLPFLRRFARPLAHLGGFLAFACAALLARRLSLDFWDTTRLDLAALGCGVGLGGLLTLTEGEQEEQPTDWLLVALGWLLGAFDPLGPWLVAGVVALLGPWARSAPEAPAQAGTSPAGTLFLLGWALPNAWWDFGPGPGFAMPTVMWALGAFAACGLRPLWKRLPSPLLLLLPLLSLAIAPLLYPWLPAWLWGLLAGLLGGWAWLRMRRPWNMTAAYAFLFGLLLSYALHSNLQIAPLRWMLIGSS